MRFILLLGLLFSSSFTFAITEPEINNLAREYQFSDTSLKKENKNVTFTGVSPSFKAIADFLEKIKKDGHTNVRYNGKGKTKSNQRAFVISFTEK